MIEIIDLNNCPIEVTNLKEALKMARQFKEYRHVNKGFSEFDKRQKAYWTDVYEKLRVLKKRLHDN